MKFARSLAVFSALFLAACASVPGGGQGIEQPISQQTPKTETSERARVHVELGRMYLAEGRFDIALDEAKLAAEIEPSYALSYDLMGLIYMALRQNEAASTAFRQALRLAPHDPEINNDYGWFLCQGGDPRGGLGHIERALANPLYAAPLKALTNAGLCALLAKDDTRAEHYFRRALTLERAHATALFWLADIAFRQGR
ncbi:MAG: tetratricopeptide repeat protein, partial [Rhodocyclaceae bacterium]|nr:tetratricopeptide repeat protein [Rhodocyclaceae bacterium]